MTEFKKIKKKQMMDISDSEREEHHIPSDAEDKTDFFLTQKEAEDSNSISDSEEKSDFDELSYDKRIGFDKKKLIDLFQDIEEKNLFLINNVQDEEQILEYIIKNKHIMIRKKEEEIKSNSLMFYNFKCRCEIKIFQSLLLL